jgi:mannose-6-phosphate isomerase-like protein (cupin superfamily)
MRHPEGHSIQPHVHKKVERSVEYTQEVLLIRSGRLTVNFYTEEKDFLFDRELRAGDVILLVKGGHGFEMLEEVEMYEVKQGPYVGEHDKERFTAS